MVVMAIFMVVMVKAMVVLMVTAMVVVIVVIRYTRWLTLMVRRAERKALSDKKLSYFLFERENNCLCNCHTVIKARLVVVQEAKQGISWNHNQTLS